MLPLSGNFDVLPNTFPWSPTFLNTLRPFFRINGTKTSPANSTGIHRSLTKTLTSFQTDPSMHSTSLIGRQFNSSFKTDIKCNRRLSSSSGTQLQCPIISKLWLQVVREVGNARSWVPDRDPPLQRQLVRLVHPASNGRPVS